MDKILLIDDEPDIRRVLAMSLRADGYEVLTAENGEAGLAVFDAQAPDIVLVDIKMPGIGGIEVLQAIKAKETLTEVIIITGHGDVDNAVEALKYGASDFINKPVRDDTLAVALQRAGEKLTIRRQLRDHTLELEAQVASATRELKRQAQFQARLIRSSTDGIVATDKDLRVVIYNPAAEKIFGYRRAEVIQQQVLADIYPADLAADFQAGMCVSPECAEIRAREATVLSQDGALIPVRFAGAILHEKGQKMGTVAFFQDLRPIKELEAALVRKERLAAIGQTVAGVAHGIKNILHGLKGGRHLVDVGITKQDNDRLQNGWDMVKRNIDRTSDLVMDLLRYSKERSPEREPCRPNDIVEEVCALVIEEAQTQNVAIVKDLDPAIGIVIMDPHSLHSVLLNLVSNAVDACRDDADDTKNFQVTMRTRREEEGLLRFEIRDNGIGMTPDVQARLFTSFFSTKGHLGTGLGMMVARKLVEEDNGTIEVESAPGEGTAVRVRLPYRAVDKK
ncbi:MAG: response regulator [Desulfobacterales bacterium]|nr:response regulator [Desulfobacterales bacterium]